MTFSAPALSCTLLIVCYNHAQYVTTCLESARKQIHPAQRVVVADDASTDDSAEVIRDYLDRYPGFATFVPHSTNQGLNATLNELLSSVETDFYAVIAADDYMRPDRLERQLTQLTVVPEAALCYSEANVVDGAGESIQELFSHRFPWPPEPARSTETFAELLTRNWIPAASLMVRTDVVKDTGGYPDLLFEDYELLIRLAKAHRFTYVPEPLVSVRVLETSMTRTALHRRNPDYIRAYDFALRHYEGTDPELHKRALSLRWELAKAALETGMPRNEARQLLIHARGGARNRLTFARHLIRSLLSRPRQAHGTGLGG